MDDVIWWVLGIVLAIAVVLIAVEANIMRKPEAERSDRERRFLRADRRAARGGQWYGRNIAPWLAIAAGVVGLALTLPLWISGRTLPAALLTGTFVVLIAGMLAFWFLVLRKRGREWRQKQDDENREADVAGRPRWFVSVRAGLLLGAGFLVFGAVLLVAGLASGHLNGFSLVVVPFGILFLVLAMLQRRGERRTDAAGRGEGDG